MVRAILIMCSVMRCSCGNHGPVLQREIGDGRDTSVSLCQGGSQFGLFCFQRAVFVREALRVRLQQLKGSHGLVAI
jgi:hypothetical protein